MGPYHWVVEQRAKTNPSRDLACVVWTAPGAAVPADLGRVLRARGLSPKHAESGFTAFAEVCVAERSGDADERGVRSLLILAGVEDEHRVLAGLERFAPSARVWVFEPGANPPLRANVVSPVSVRAGKPDQTHPELTGEDLEAVTRRPRVAGSVDASAQERPATVAELKLTPTPEPTPEPQPEPAPKHARRDVTQEPKPNGRPAPPVSARDVLDDAELEMLLSGERGGDGGAR